jgi:DNA-binding GntR family transcriptional regulator
MEVARDRIPDKVLREIFPTKLNRSQPSNEVYAQLKRNILSGKLKKGQRLIQEEVVQRFNLNKATVTTAFSRLRKEKLIITKRGIGSFVTWGSEA